MLMTAFSPSMKGIWPSSIWWCCTSIHVAIIRPEYKTYKARSIPIHTCRAFDRSEKKAEPREPQTVFGNRANFLSLIFHVYYLASGIDRAMIE